MKAKQLKQDISNKWEYIGFPKLKSNMPLHDIP